jgi:hypothetical protein
MPAPLPPTISESEPPGSFLFSDEAMQEITDQEKRGNYTAERLARLRPDTLKACIKLLCDKWPKIEIARTLNVTEKTVVAVADHHADKITELEKHFSKKLRRVAWDQLDRVERNPGIIPAQAIAQAVKFFYETAQLADGRPTEIVEEIQRVDIWAHWKRFVAGDEIGLAGGKIPPVIDGELVESPAPAVPATDRPGLPASGLQSEENGHVSQVTPADCCNFCDDSVHESARKSPAEPAAKSPARADPPGGTAAFNGGASVGTDNGSQKI